MSCVVWKCKSRMGNKKNQSEIASFHRFPLDESRRDQWVIAVSTEDGWTPKKHHRVCSKHFTDGCFTTDDKGRRRLRDNAIPTLLLKKGIHATMPLNTCRLALHPSDKDVVSSLLLPATTNCADSLPQKVDAHTTELINPTTLALYHNTIDKLKKENLRLKTLAQRRLLKINVLKQRARRLKKKTQDINLKLNDFMEKEKVLKEDFIMLESVKREMS